MTTRIVVLMAWITLHSTTALGQSAVRNAVIVNVGKSTVTVGCDTAQVFDRSNLALVKEQCEAEEYMIGALIKDLQPNGAVAYEVKALRKEQKAWEHARQKHCANEALNADSMYRDLAIWNCREWADRCRLVQVMETYDRIVPTKE